MADGFAQILYLPGSCGEPFGLFLFREGCCAYEADRPSEKRCLHSIYQVYGRYSSSLLLISCRDLEEGILDSTSGNEGEAFFLTGDIMSIYQNFNQFVHLIEQVLV